ncbi:hypothetical protein K504DRAFT_466317 [Pleomassaria siparia CBS 279.74]|uniref:Uncharacterized protein n=1 Tax=Pleomassaria siparia CBS 279.74 TaxID=1314801 RepID=A0A6G1JQD3_9PLEO|nr:hypothetical protein K504DRAFT_466317 [Pleomassaria siparia CBS 279.74]
MSILVTLLNLNYLVGQYPRLELIANASISFNITMLMDNELRAFKKRGLRLLTNPTNIKQVRLADSTYNAKSRAKLINGMLLRINIKGDDGTTLEEQYAFVYNTLVEEATNCY